MTLAITLAIISLTVFSVIKSHNQFKRNIILQAVSLSKSFRNNILLGDARVIINNYQSLGPDIQKLEILDSKCKSISGSENIYPDCANSINVLKNEGSGYSIIVPIYFSDDTSSVANYCSFIFSKLRMHETTRHILIVSLALLVIMAAVLIANIKIYNVSQRRFINEIISMIRNHSFNIGSEAKNILGSSPFELKPIFEELIQLSQNLYSSSKKLKEYEVAATIGRAAAMIAHDIRSPLSVIKTYVEMIEPETAKNEALEMREAALRSVKKLVRLVSDMRDDQVITQIQKTCEDMRLQVVDAMKEVGVRHGETKISLICDDSIKVIVDANKFNRVMVNLLINAVEAMEGRSGVINVEVSRDSGGSGVLIAVADNGRGISKEAQSQIFDTFYTREKKGGSGLGLAYCKQVVEAHGGTIDVSSEEGKGAIFSIRIPNCVVNSDQAKEVVTAVTEKNPLAVVTDISNLLKTRILVADDDPEIRKQWMRIILGRGGELVYAAATAADIELNETLDFSRIDTAIVDYQYEGEERTGVDLIKYLKGKGVKKVYLCTGFFDDDEVRRKAYAVGVDGMLRKPLEYGLRCD